MGSYQSRLSAGASPHEKAIIERLSALELEKKEDLTSGYVYLQDGNQVNEKGRADVAARQPESISVSLMAKWQDALLDDPKNR